MRQLPSSSLSISVWPGLSAAVLATALGCDAGSRGDAASDGAATGTQGDGTDAGATDGQDDGDAAPTTGGSSDDSTGAQLDEYEKIYASVISVEVSGTPGDYTFSVGVFSPDSGCERYANWWEVVDEDGGLIFRRILTHSHVPPMFEQPFVRSGGPVVVGADDIVTVRAHMNTSGFGYRTFRGSVADGLTEHETTPDFAAGLESVPPQPGECPF
ncbi:MAG: hypothetical protein JKY37_22035 [Nannocystaceae bacterium]|nr:hypothetical protein [Nannocystaceae bacterium]